MSSEAGAEAEGWKLELEAGSWSWRLDAGCWQLEAGHRKHLKTNVFVSCLVFLEPELLKNHVFYKLFGVPEARMVEKPLVL